MEAFLLEKIQGGASLPGTYPPSAETIAAFAVWRKEQLLDVFKCQAQQHPWQATML